MALFRPSEFLRAANPRGALADFREVYKQAGSNRWKFALVSAIATIAVFSVMFQEEGRAIPKPPKITYISTLPPGRSDAEIMAENRANQIVKERLAAEQAKRDEEVRGIYRKIGEMSGMDVDAIEKKAAADRAAEAAARRAQGTKTQ
jgi:hypothetical protein